MQHEEILMTIKKKIAKNGNALSVTFYLARYIHIVYKCFKCIDGYNSFLEFFIALLIWHYNSSNPTVFLSF